MRWRGAFRSIRHSTRSFFAAAIGGDGFRFLIDQVMQVEGDGLRLCRPGIEIGEIKDGGDDPVQLARRRAGGVEEQARGPGSHSRSADRARTRLR